MTNRKTTAALAAASLAVASAPALAQSHDEHVTETPAASKAATMTCPKAAEENEARHHMAEQQQTSEMHQMMQQMHTEMQQMHKDMMQMRQEMQRRRSN